MRFLWIFLLPLLSFSQKNGELTEAVHINPLALKYKFPIEIDSILEESPNSPPYQYAGTLFSMIGLEQEAFDNFYSRYNPRKPIDDTSFTIFEDLYSPINARNYILERAKKEQIVIINEAHHKGKHRVFSKSILKELYELGYRHLGIEALSLYPGYTDTLLNERKYPTINSGFYIIESNFGNMVREALKIGYKLFPYEGEGNGKEREINQAENIKSYLEKYPNEKAIIHCGYEHAKEGKLNTSWEKAMAGRLLELTGINPLTINQTTFDNRWDSSYLNPLMQRLDLSEPTVFIDSDSLSYLGEVDNKGFDIYVFHEQTKLFLNRPLWRKALEDELVKIELANISFSEPYLLMAFKKTEDYTIALPEDLIYIDPIANSSSAYLILEDNEYNLIAQTHNGQAILFSLSFSKN